MKLMQRLMSPTLSASAKYIGTLSHQTQFITITHNRETMAQSNTLYGVTMGDDGISKLLSIKLEQAKVFAK